MMQLKRVLYIAKYAIKNGYNIPILSASFRTDWILWEEKRKKTHSGKQISWNKRDEIKKS